MYMVLMFLSLTVVIVMAMAAANLALYKDKFSTEAVYPIESGFLSYYKDFMGFNLSFFIILLLFVLFDVEIIFIIFFPLLNKCYFSVFILFYFILLTLWFEWKWGKLLWY